MRIKVVLEQAKEGGYTVCVPLLHECIAEENTLEEAVENIKETVDLYVELGDLMQLINMEDVWMKKS